MNNKRYLQSIGVPEDKQQDMLIAMDTHGSNHWWESTNSKERAYHQTMEIDKSGILFYAFSRYHKDIEELLGRPVFTHEFGISSDSLIQEAERAWKYNVGVTSEAERQERLNESLNKLADFARKNNKQIIGIDVEE